MSRRAHIAMASIPAPGHVNPSLEIIRELVARGHRVSYINDPMSTEAVTATGADLVPYSTRLPVGTGGSAWPEDRIGIADLFLDDAMAMLAAARPALDGDRPDLFLYDIAGAAARVLADNWDRPSLQLSPTYVAWQEYEQDMAAEVAAMKQDPRGAEHYRRFAAWLADNGLAGTDPDRFMGRPEHALVLIPRALQPHADSVDPERYTFIGPCFGSRSEQGVWTRPDDAEKVLLVSLGSAFTDQPAFYRACSQAFGSLPGWHVVLQVGRYVDIAGLGEVPANVEVHRWVAQLAVLEQCDAFVTHAGMGGSTEGLYCGLPMIAVPQAVDQFGNADALVDLGVGRRLDTEQATPEALRTALLELTGDPEVARRSAAIRRELREEGGTARAADAALTDRDVPGARFQGVRRPAARRRRMRTAR
ncbi:macrolide family glycosyltransferase [Nocardiopsis ansamitocini]|uniref:Macrolide-inactivating glycosyltransferase n=1 Tax=Nocardiopsis ansamitocini TaxID=1670832 RepID=A0A9W6P712_9ACTN|nr:macrolide family glycosyltransferase [Nocardiopsis ansamitocini]GLU48237.1 macrolide-inactivating glycosyltransferase [Nocardiopsis ansamitocini]